MSGEMFGRLDTTGSGLPNLGRVNPVLFEPDYPYPATAGGDDTHQSGQEVFDKIESILSSWIVPGAAGSGVDATGVTAGYVPTAQGDDTFDWEPVEIDLSSATAATPATSDYLVGTDTSNANANAKFLVSEILALSTVTQYTDEMARDAIGAALVAGSGITITPNDGADTITIATSGSVGVAVQEGDTTVVTSASTLDFGAGFDVTESPSGEANIALDLSEPGAVTPAIADTVAGSDASNSSANATFTVENLALVPWSSEFVRNQARLFTDCTSLIGYGTPGSLSSLGDYVAAHSSGAISRLAGEANHVGVIQLSTTTSSTGAGAIYSFGAVFLLGGGQAVFETLIRIPTLSDVSETFTVRAGFLDGSNPGASTPTDGVFFEYLSGTSANWRTRTYAAGSVAATTTSTAVAAATWTRLTIVVNAAGTSAEFFVDGVSVATETTGIPVTAGQETGSGVGILKTNGTTARTLDVDYVLTTVDLTTAR